MMMMLGYWVRFADEPPTFFYFMSDQPPSGQYKFKGIWKPLIDPWYLMDLIMSGDVDLDGPFDDPPEGVPPFEPSPPVPSNQ
jgi:hypothetical protein